MEKKLLLQNLSTENSWIYWFIGFMDADGSFQIFPKKRSYKLKNGSNLFYFSFNPKKIKN